MFRDDIENCPAPTRFFEIGQKVQIGVLQNCRVKDVSSDGKLITVLHDKVWTEGCGSRKFDSRYDIEGEWFWHQCFPEVNANTDFSKKTYRDLNYQNRDISDLILMVLSSGMDFDAVYQRPLVWSDEQKQEYVTSIVTGGDIGKFLIGHTKKVYPYYEMVDGKQRLTTIVDFYLGRFKYQGFYFHDLSNSDRGYFKNRAVGVCLLPEGVSEKEKLYHFLRVNIPGVPQDEKHIERVKKLFEQA